MGNHDKVSEAFSHAVRVVMRGALTVDGIITAVDTTKFTCDVKIGDETYFEVPLMVLTGSQASCIQIPTVNSACLMIFRDNNIGQPQLLMVDKVQQLLIKTQVIFNDGKLGGMVKAKELQTQSNKDKAILDALLNILTGPPINEPGNGAPSALQTALKGVLSGKSSGVWNALENSQITQ
jgi:hypothetical protein